MRDIVLLALAVVVVTAAALGGLRVYSGQQLAALEGAALYFTPEEGMRILVSDHYSGVEQVEIVHAGYEPCFLNNLYSVEARVWADARTDGKAVKAEGDNPGGFFPAARRGLGLGSGGPPALVRGPRPVAVRRWMRVIRRFRR